MTTAFVEISVVGGMAIGVGCVAFFACARAFRRVARRRGDSADAEADVDAATKTAAEKDEEEATATTVVEVVEVVTATPPLRKKYKIVPCDAC